MEQHKTKTALITGGTSGVGLSLVKGLLQQHYRVFFVGASTTKGQALEREFAHLYPGKATFVGLDLSDLQAVDRFAKDFAATQHRLDLLVHVAGVLLPQRTLTDQGNEKTFTIGYLSPFLLSGRLSGILGQTVGARIVNVAAAAKSILALKLDFEDLQFDKNYNGFKASLATVHAKTVLTEILAQRLAPLGITVNAFHPGMVRSRLTRNMPLVLRLVGRAISPLMAQSSDNGIYVCTSPFIDNVTGQLFEKQTPIALSFAPKYKADLWLKTNQILARLHIQLHENGQDMGVDEGYE